MSAPRSEPYEAHERGEFVAGLGWSCVICDTFGCPGVAPTDREIAEALGYVDTDERGDPTKELAGPAPRVHVVQAARRSDRTKEGEHDGE